MMLQTGAKTSAIHILPDNSKSSGNQKMKFGQLIENKVRKVFLQKSYRK